MADEPDKPNAMSDPVVRRLVRETGITEAQAREILAALDAEGRWVSKFQGESLVGQPKFKTGTEYISSEVFAKNLERLSAYLAPAE